MTFISAPTETYIEPVGSIGVVKSPPKQEPVGNGGIEQFNGREAETATLFVGLFFYS